MSKVICNNCMSIFNENRIVYDQEADMEFCPICGKSGYLMDLHDEDYVPSAENGDYSPGNPWDAPGMSIHDFI